ncbi:hypothetical protein ROZALSC1DRAFT_26433 [Rozella allomycis CSF55]|uniref:Uncharacterized protein n=1 Tax=Rozella allomycis (strain CSF55) TaxID=988480 RepID=A0A075AQN0_ROZAC|nr:hypothetical protein O9G_001484 [Rozella allomycis CSF55]RKP22190.1 hypothetical protein ROZALSC1DRAFT_26433 [Rozella allomycis CSF55]|eukprot:EPZ31010.1 hypothetical protein O9G_001484 [Rozella allomycis CSF55]
MYMPIPTNEKIIETRSKDTEPWIKELPSSVPVKFRLMKTPDVEGTRDVVESVDGSIEDIFTFETFTSLFQMAIKANKDFILARVTTQDESGKLFYSIYQAHHINKVLFRTQPEEGLLHRMKARNPLNNMTVVGDVHYYKIPSDLAKQAWNMQYNDSVGEIIQSSVRTENQVKCKSKRFSSGDWESLLDVSRTTLKSSKDSALSDLFPARTMRKEKRHTRSRSIEKQCNFTEERQSLLKVHAVSMIDIRPNPYYSDEISTKPVKVKNDPEPLTFDLEYFATDDDFLMKSSIREYFKQMSVEENDYVLFTLYPSDQTAVPMPDVAPAEFVPSLSNLYGVLRRKNIKWFVLIYLAVSSVVLNYVVPLQYVYLVAFLLIFFLVFLVVLFTECFSH